MNAWWMWLGVGLFFAGLGAALAWSVVIVGGESEEVAREWTF